MNNRIGLLVCLDTTLLLLVCLLEPIKLTGLEWHQWLGFALCPLVLLHVILQWPWLISQFQGVRHGKGDRGRINALLNLTLFVLMAAVVYSGVLGSRQATALVGESFGRVRLWREVHGWLNFVLVVMVGLHLALNWDWIVAACRRRTPGPRTKTVTTRRWSLTLWKLLARGFVVVLAASLAAGAAYFAIQTTLPPGKRADLHRRPVINAAAPRSQKLQLSPDGRAPEVLNGLPGLAITVSVVLLAAVIGRHLFRLRL